MILKIRFVGKSCQGQIFPREKNHNLPKIHPPCFVKKLSYRTMTNGIIMYNYTLYTSLKHIKKIKNRIFFSYVRNGANFIIHLLFKERYKPNIKQCILCMVWNSPNIFNVDLFRHMMYYSHVDGDENFTSIHGKYTHNERN